MNLYLSDLSDNACAVAWRVMREHFGFDVWAYNGPSPWNDRTRAATFCIPLHTTAGMRYGEELLAALTALDTKDRPLYWFGDKFGWCLTTQVGGEPDMPEHEAARQRLFYAGPADAFGRTWILGNVAGVDTDDRAASLYAALLHVGANYAVPAC